MKHEYDLAVIGAGTAGLVSSVVADALGARVCLIERARVGGECLWTGCVPSKTLIRAAKVREIVNRSQEFGVNLEKPRVQWSAVKLRIQDVRDEIRRLEREELDKSRVEIISGEASFLDAHTLRVTSKDGERTLTARKFILATGTRPNLPNVFGLDEVGVLTHRDVYGLPNLPRSLTILGGGPEGVEFGQAFARLGVKVTILHRGPRLLERDEPDASELLLKLLTNEGVTVHLNAQVTHAGRDDSNAWLEWSDGNGDIQRATASRILSATGKRFDVESLNARAAGVKTNESGFVVNAQLRTSAPHIYACGDCANGPRFTHWAEHTGKIAAQNALLPVKVSVETRAVPWVTFTDPEVARVGRSEADARKSGAVRVWRQEFATLDRAIIEGETSGFLKVVTTQSGRVLGATIIGSNAGELIAPWVFAVREGKLLHEFADATLPYPTLSEIGHRAGNAICADALNSKLLRRALKLFVR